jgi:C-terminal processing protease CtpA/Prc
MKQLLTFALLLCLGGNLPHAAQAQDKGEKKQSKTVRVTASTKTAWIGVMLKDVVEVTAGSKAKKSTGSKGALVSEVVDDSPAEKAGIEDGDVIVEFDGKKIADATGLVDAVKKAEIGKAVPVIVMRDGDKKTMSIEPGRAPKSAQPRAFSFSAPNTPMVPGVPMVPGAPMAPKAPFAMNIPHMNIMRAFAGAGSGQYGMKLMQLDGQLAEYFGAPNNKGVLVENVKKDSPADKAGFKAGDVLVRAGKKTIEDAGDVRAAFGAYDKGEKLPFEVIRKGTRLTLDLEVAEAEESDEDNTMFFGHPGEMRVQSFGEDGPEDIDINVDLDGLKGDLDNLKDELKELEITVPDDANSSDDAHHKIERRVKIKVKKDGKDI